VSELKKVTAAIITMVIIFIMTTSGCIGNENASSEVVKTKYLSILETTDDRYTAIFYSEKIRQAVKDNVTSWKELGMNDSDIDRMIKEARIRGIEPNLAILNNTYNRNYARSSAEYIREEVRNGDTSWIKLGMKESDINLLLEVAYERSDEESRAAQKRRNDESIAISCFA
jgi:hypothetical protein